MAGAMVKHESDATGARIESELGRITFRLLSEHVLLVTYVGHGDKAMLDAVVQEFDRLQGHDTPVVSFHDCWDLAGYDSEFRRRLTAWGKTNNTRAKTTYVLLRSRLIEMGVSVASMVLREPLRAVSKRVEFEAAIEAAKAGQPAREPDPVA